LWSHRAYDANVKRIDCACGQVIEAENDEELWEKAQAHLRTDHPDLVGKVSRKDRRRNFRSHQRPARYCAPRH
jgi:hypothetical protein